MPNNLGGVYETGTLTINPDRVTVVGIGTLWGPIAEVGDWLLVNGQVGLIEAVADDTHLLLQSPWQGTLPSASVYVLVKMSWLRYEPALTQAKLRELLAELEGAGTFIFTDVAPPDPAIGEDGDWALKTDSSPWQLWFKDNGVWIEQATPAGLDWDGAWSAATSYVAADAVERLGSSYVSKTANLNKPPESNPADWDLMAAKGAAGATGASGPAGLVWRGTWSSATAYVINDGVAHGGASYIAIANNTNSAPPSANWNLLLAQSGSASIVDDAVTPPMLDADTSPKQLLFRDRLNLVSRAGDTMSGHLALPTAPAAANATRKDYVDAQAALRVAKTGDTMTGPLTVSSGAIFCNALAGGDAVFRMRNEASAAKGELYWSRAEDAIYLVSEASGGAGISIYADGSSATGRGVRGRQGRVGATTLTNNNFYWNGALEYWADSSNMGNITLTSDYRIKKDVADLPATWDIVKALRPIKYTQAQYTPQIEIANRLKQAAAAREAGGRETKPGAVVEPMFPADDIERWGFIAHELQATLIESAATGVKDDPVCVQSPNPWTVIAALTKALQEAMQRIEALEAAAR